MVLRLGMAGLGAASSQVLPALEKIRDKIKLTAVADIRAEARERFARDFGVATFESVEALAKSDQVDAVWVATPNPLHAEHTICLAEHGKHVICEKPMATNLEECRAMIRAIEKNGVHYVQGHSKIFDPPIQKMGELIAAGAIGEVFQINTWNYNDWLMRPRLATEVDTALGGGIVYRQGPHLIDIARYLGGGMATHVTAQAGRHDPHFATEGDFSAFIEFANDAVASISINGYGFFDVTELTWDIGEGGRLVDPARRGTRPRLTGPVEAEAKYQWAADGRHEGQELTGDRDHAPFFGLTVVAGDQGVIRQSPDGIFLYTASGRREVPCGGSVGRGAELLELHQALEQDRSPFPDARWGMATLELALAVLESSAHHRERVALQHQVARPTSNR